MAKRKQLPPVPKTEKEFGRREMFVMISPFTEIDKEWAFHGYNAKEVQEDIDYWDLVHEGHELKGACKIARVTIIYEET